MTDRVAYSVKEVARLLGVSRAWLYQCWKRGEGPPRCRVGCRTLIPAQELLEWLDRQSVCAPRGGRR